MWRYDGRMSDYFKPLSMSRGGVTRVADTKARKIQLEFDGFAPTDAVPLTASRAHRTATKHVHGIDTPRSLVHLKRGTPATQMVDARDGLIVKPADARPDAVALGAGAQIYDAGLGQPLWSNGTTWTDAGGIVV